MKESKRYDELTDDQQEVIDAMIDVYEAVQGMTLGDLVEMRDSVSEYGTDHEKGAADAYICTLLEALIENTRK